MLRPLPTLTLILALASTAPSGWTLCVGPGGHVVVEPVATVGEPCCVPGDVAKDACAPEDCGDCSDVDLSAGVSLRARPGIDLSLPAPVWIPASEPAWVEPASRVAIEILLTCSPAAPPPDTIVLRC